jgi:hypothetical protein
MERFCQAPEIRFSFHSTYNLGNLIVSGAIRDPNLGRWLSCSLQIVLCAMDRISGEFLQTKVGLTVDFRSVTVQMCQRSLGYKARRVSCGV